MEVEAVDEGTIGKIVIAEGAENVAVNAVIAYILEEDEDASALDNISATGSAAKAEAAPAPAAEAAMSEVNATQDEKTYTSFKTQTVREALRDAMAEEMRSDENVYVMGEEVAQYQGAYKVTQGLLDEFGDKRVVDTPITEYGFTGMDALHVRWPAWLPDCLPWSERCRIARWCPAFPVLCIMVCALPGP